MPGPTATSPASGVTNATVGPQDFSALSATPLMTTRVLSLISSSKPNLQVSPLSRHSQQHPLDLFEGPFQLPRTFLRRVVFCFGGWWKQQREMMVDIPTAGGTNFSLHMIILMGHSGESFAFCRIGPPVKICSKNEVLHKNDLNCMLQHGTCHAVNLLNQALLPVFDHIF